MNTVPIASVRLCEDEVEAVSSSLRSGHLVAGPAVARFEEEFARFTGARFALAVSSGTAALHIAYLATLRPGDEVLVPGFTHISTASMVHFAGGRPVLCDVDRRTFTISVEDAARKAGPRTAAIAPVHLFGNCCDVDGVMQLARAHHLKVIWDAAQAHGTRWRGTDIGTLPDCVTYSFYPTKNMTTGEGGMIVTGDEELHQRCRLLRGHGQTAKYYHESLGLNYRMTEAGGALGAEQLKKLGRFIEARRRNANYLSERLADLEGITVPWAPEAVEHSFHQYSVLLDLERFRCSRDEFVAALRAEGVEAAVHYPRALNQQPALARCKVPLPNCEWLTERIMSLPVHPALSSQELSRVAGAVSKVASAMRR